MTCHRHDRDKIGAESLEVVNIGNPVAYTAGQWHWANYKKTMIKMLLHTISQPSSVLNPTCVKEAPIKMMPPYSNTGLTKDLKATAKPL